MCWEQHQEQLPLDALVWKLVVVTGVGAHNWDE